MKKNKRRTLPRRNAKCGWTGMTLGCALALILAQPAHAEGKEEEEKQKEALVTVTVTGSREDKTGVVSSANTGVVTGKQIAARTVYRAAEVLEAVPGLIVSQHSGEGKANQFYLRGFNLDHGTDLRTTVDGMLVNQRSHGHGQGWTDLNFLIPELISRLEYRKGPYYAPEGDFASAGTAAITYADQLGQGVASIGVGQNGFRRGLLADSPDVGGGRLLYALEALNNDGPFTAPDAYRKRSAVLRYSEESEGKRFDVTLMAYRGRWNATDQIPQRAVSSGALGRFDTIDTTDGGHSHRYSLSGAWQRSGGATSSSVNAYLAHNELDLYSNFTYFLDDPVNGDQFNQRDRRTSLGLQARHGLQGSLFGHPSETALGIQAENDNIFNGLFNTVARRRLATTRADHIVETSAGVFVENTTRWSPTVRTVAGVRADAYRFRVGSDTPLNSGKARASIASPKLNLIFGPFAKTEYYLNLGTGFHSNDARGTTIRVAPNDPATPVERVPALARSRGIEAGLRSELIAGMQSSLSVYQLNLDSELVFVGDAGTTEAGRPSRRSGIEFNHYYKPASWLTIDTDLAYARARFTGGDAAGRHIPGAVEGVASVALAIDSAGPFTAALQLRYFGSRPLIEDNGVRSHSTATLNGRIGYRISPTMRVELEGFNLANRRASAIDYYYESRLPGEPIGSATGDIHFHPIESRSFRLMLTKNF